MRTTRKKKNLFKEKQLYEYCKRQTDEIAHEKTWTLQRKGNLKKKTEYLLITVQNNAKSTNYIKANIYNTQ